MSLMKGFKRLFRWPRPDVRRDVDDELQLHIEMKTQDLVDAGIDPLAADPPHLFWEVQYERRSFEVDPLRCSRCGHEMRIVAFITQPRVIDRILTHLRRTSA